MSVPKTNLHPPFRFLRASHAILTSRDLAKSREFYTEVLGLVVSDEDKDTLYLRGLEERAHHSLTVKRSQDEPACLRVGMRVHDEEELERARHTFEQHGLPCRWADSPFQGRTLHTVDIAGTPLDDLVFLERDGPAFHHYGYIVPDVQSMLRACDVMGDLGWGENVQFGPGKHSVGHSYYVYLRDPDGHCVELLLPPIVYMDGDDPPSVFDVRTVKSPQVAWGLPPRASWFAQRTPFRDCQVTHPADGGGDGLTLEQYLGLTGPAEATDRSDTGK